MTTRPNQRRIEAAAARDRGKRRRRWAVLAAAIAVATVAVVLVVLPRLRPDAVPELDEEGRRALAEAEAHFNAGRYDQAIAVAEKDLEREPDAPGLHYLAGAALQEKGEHRRSVSHLEAAIERTPRHLDSQIRLGVARTELGEIEAANEALRAALAIEPTNARASLLLGRNLARTGHVDEAEPVLRHAAEGLSGGASASAWDELGLLYREREDLARAEEAFRTALAADADHLGALFHLGQILVRQGREEEGQRFLGRHAELEARNNRIDLLRQRAMEEGAEAEDQVNLGRYLLLQHDLEGATTTFLRALERDAAYAPALVGLGQAQIERGANAEAVETLAQAAAAAPDSAEAHFFLGLARHLERDYAGAQQALARSRQLRPWTAAEFLFFGNVLASSGSLADAELAYRSSLETGPEIPEARYKLGLVLQARDRAAEARSELERFVVLEPRDPRGALLLGVAQHRAGDAAAAEASFRAALDRARVALPDPRALDAMLDELRVLPGAPEALRTLEKLRDGSSAQPQ